MTIQVVPTGSEPFFDQTTPLDGTPYKLTFAFNQREGCWKLSLAAIDGTPIASGLKLVCQWSLLLKCASPLRPPGILLVHSATNDTSPPGLLDLLPSGRCSLLYLPAADLLAGIAAGPFVP